jgi:hypothetical protein
VQGAFMTSPVRPISGGGGGADTTETEREREREAVAAIHAAVSALVAETRDLRAETRLTHRLLRHTLLAVAALCG